MASGADDREAKLLAAQFSAKECDELAGLLATSGWQTLIRYVFANFKTERRKLLADRLLTNEDRLVYIGHLEGILRLLSLPYLAAEEPVPAALKAFCSGDV